MDNELKSAPDNLLVKYLLGEATETETEQVTDWIDADADNKKYFDQFRLIWDESKQFAARSEVTAEDAWNRFMDRAKEVSPQNTTPKTIPLRSFFTWTRAAALIGAVLGIGLLAYFINDGFYSTQLIASNETSLTTTLPDGSVVTLNKHSSLRYRKAFNGDKRNVTLEGEGFFNVAPNKSKPFIIAADEARITVVGTSFNVKSSAEKTEVVVETGIVEVAKNSYTVNVNPHEKATVIKGQVQPLKQNNQDVLYKYYRSKEFVCDGTPLWRLVEVLNEAYAASIIIEDEKLKNLPLNTTFRNDSLEDILNVLTATFPEVQVVHSDGRIILK